MNTVAELVNSATSDQLSEMDWMINIEICELVARDPSKAKDVLTAIKESLRSEKANTKLYAVMLLEMLINNIGEPIHEHVADTGILTVLVEIAKMKTDLPLIIRIFLLLDGAQKSLGGASGKFPEYYSAYNELVSAGIQFPERPHGVPKPRSLTEVKARHKEFVALESQTDDSESSIILKAETAMGILRDVLNNIDGQHPQASTNCAKDDFTLDLVEQCSFHKQRIIHLAVTSRKRRIIQRAFELNDELYSVLHRHDTLASPNDSRREQEDDDGEDELLRWMRTGEDKEERGMYGQRSLMGYGIPRSIIGSPITRPPAAERGPDLDETKKETARALSPELERAEEDSGLDGHMKNLSMGGRDAGGSRSGGEDVSD